MSSGSNGTTKQKVAAVIVIGLCIISVLLDNISISSSTTSLPSFSKSSSNTSVGNLRRLLSVVPTDGDSGGDHVSSTIESTRLLLKDESFRINSNEFPYPLTCDKNELQTFLQRNNLIVDTETNEKKFTLTLVYHIGMVGNWETVVTDQFHTLHTCGTLDLADQLFVSYSNGDRTTLDSFLYVLLGEHNKHKLRRIVESTKSPWEGPAMNMMLDHCSSHRTNNNNLRISSDTTPSPKEEIIFYFHNKGTSKYTSDWRMNVHKRRTYAYSLYWRKYIEYYTIERPQLCLEKLLSKSLLTLVSKKDEEDEEEHYTSCGPNWRPANDNWGNHYSGNFWSATCDHINTRESLDGKRTNYLSGEMWISNPGDVNKQAKLTMYNTEKGLYSNLILPEEYAL